MREIWFWQQIHSPHMAGLAESLVELGCSVTFVVEALMSERRKALGWTVPSSKNVNTVVAASPKDMIHIANGAPISSIHVSGGMRGNGQIGVAQRTLRRRRLRSIVALETVNGAGWRGRARGLLYRHLIFRFRARNEALLAIGHRTDDWLLKRGAPPERLFPFAYFLPSCPTPDDPGTTDDRLFRLVFVGQFIARKRLDLLVDALAEIAPEAIELVVIGSGPMEDALRAAAESALPGQVRWIGRVRSDEVAQHIAEADCLVLPSRHDGWGAVVSEAMMGGTPVICSDACGAAGTVLASGSGGVFHSEDKDDLKAHLVLQLAVGKVSPERRYELAQWARCLAADAGAKYLLAILDHLDGTAPRPLPPWLAEVR